MNVRGDFLGSPHGTHTTGVVCKKGKRKFQGVPQSQTAALPRPQEEEESLILALQRSNETFKYIKHHSKCVKLLCKENMIFLSIFLKALVIGVICLWLFNLLILSGDIQPNPGPDCVNSITDNSYSTSESLFDDLSNHFSILHVNIQSLYPKWTWSNAKHNHTISLSFLRAD